MGFLPGRWTRAVAGVVTPAGSSRSLVRQWLFFLLLLFSNIPSPEEPRDSFSVAKRFRRSAFHSETRRIYSDFFKLITFAPGRFFHPPLDGRRASQFRAAQLNLVQPARQLNNNLRRQRSIFSTSYSFVIEWIVCIHFPWFASKEGILRWYDTRHWRSITSSTWLSSGAPAHSLSADPQRNRKWFRMVQPRSAPLIDTAIQEPCGLLFRFFTDTFSIKDNYISGNRIEYYLKLSKYVVPENTTVQ